MDKKDYLAIRSHLNFQKKTNMLLLHVALDAVILAFCFFAQSLQTGWIASVISPILLAAFMFRSFSMMHEAVHGIALSSVRGNTIVGYIYGGFCLMPYSQWKQIHLDHHQWSGNIEKDPTMKVIRTYQLTRNSGGPVQAVAWKLWLPWLAIRQQLVFWTKSIAMARANKTKGEMALASGLMLSFVIGGVWLLGTVSLLLGVLAYLTLVEVVNFPHHLALPQNEGDFKLTPMDQHRISRTCVYSLWFERLVLLNFNFHVEHHLFPTLPWYQLQKAHPLVREALGKEYNFSQGNRWLRGRRKGSFESVLQDTIPRKKRPDNIRERAA